MLDRTQKIKGFALPAAFIRAVNEHTLGPEDGPWVMRDDRDAFNHPIEMDLSEVYQDMPTLVEENEHFAVGFEPSDEYGMRNIEEISVPGAIADIVDFNAIVCFGTAGTDRRSVLITATF